MAITTRAELIAAIVSWLHRDDVETIAPDLISLAEEQISRDLADLPIMLKTQTGIALGALANTLSLPVDAFGVERLQITDSSDVRIVPIAELPGFDSAAVYGQPRLASITGTASDGSLTVRVYPWADDDYTLSATYPGAVTALSDSVTSNFVLLRAPSLYLFGALIESALFVGQDARMGLWASRYQQGLENFKARAWGGDTRLSTDVPGHGAFNINTG